MVAAAIVMGVSLRKLDERTRQQLFRDLRQLLYDDAECRDALEESETNTGSLQTLLADLYAVAEGTEDLRTLLGLRSR